MPVKKPAAPHLSSLHDPFWIFILFLAFPGNVIAQQIDPASILGTYWNDKRRAQIEIYEEDGIYFGRIAWRFESIKDEKNPDPALRDREVVGIVFLKDFTFNGKDEWGGGRVYSPDNGKTYKGKLWMENPNTLKMRGFIGMSLIGRTATFYRVEEEADT